MHFNVIVVYCKNKYCVVIQHAIHMESITLQRRHQTETDICVTKNEKIS